MSFQPSCKTGLIPTYYMKQIELYNTVNQQAKHYKKRVSKKYETLFFYSNTKITPRPKLYSINIPCSFIYSAGDIPLNFLNERKKEVRELKPHCSDNETRVYLEADLSCIQNLYLQPIITQYFIDNKSEIWLLFLIAHSKR